MDNLNITVSIKHETILAKLFLENEMQTVHILAKIPANESFSALFQLSFLIRIVVSYFKKVPKLVHTELTHILFKCFCLKPKFLISFDNYYHICFKQEPTPFIGTKV